MNIKSLVLSIFVFLCHLSYSQDFYDMENVQLIEIVFPTDNWDSTLDNYYSNDVGEKLMGSVTINGVFLDSVGVKYKGNSTYSSNNAKNPLHIYLDYMIDDQNYDGYESIKLSNGKNDPSFVREVLSYEIARKYMTAPYSNYAKVYINGSFYGVFSSSEAINSDFVDDRMSCDKDNVRVKCNPESTSYGNGPSLEYLGPDSTSYYPYYEMKSDNGWAELVQFTYDLENSTSTIEDVLDVDRAIWLMAFNNVLVNLDSYIGIYRQNYYMVQDDNGLFVPIVWDLNESFGSFAQIDNGSSGGGPGRPGSSTGTSSLSEVDIFLRQDDDTYPLLQLIYDNDRYLKMYVAHYKTILEENFESGWYAERADSLQDVISSDVSSDPNAFYSISEFLGNIDGTESSEIGITELMSARMSFIQSEAVYGYEAPIIGEPIIPEDVLAFSTVNVIVEVTGATYVELGYRHSKNDVFTKVEMYDDGNHDDGAAGDNVYGVVFIVDESNTHFYIYADNDEAGVFSPVRAQYEYHKISADADYQEETDVVINEVLASNSDVMFDNMGEYDDWIELYNNTGEVLSLEGYYLTDDNDELTQWAFPDTSILPNSYLIVWADNDEEQAGLHANFKLSASGESVYLIDPEYTIVNVSDFENQVTDVSFARLPNGEGDFVGCVPSFALINELISSVSVDASDDVLFYPNPVNNCLFVKASGSTDFIVSDMMGRTISCSIMSTDNGIVTVDVSCLKNGMYLLVSGTKSSVFIKY